MTTHLSLSNRCQAEPMPLSPLAAVSQLRAFATRRRLEGALERTPVSFSGCCHPVLSKLPVPGGAQVALGSDMWAPQQLCLSSEAPVSHINGSVNFLTMGLGRAAPWLSSSPFPTSYQKIKPPMLFLYLPLPGFLERQQPLPSTHLPGDQQLCASTRAGTRRANP